MVLVVRQDLGMGKGKIAAQVLITIKKSSFKTSPLDIFNLVCYIYFRKQIFT